MTMHRRPLGRGRSMAALGGVLMVVGSVAASGGRSAARRASPRESGNGLAGSGILVFLVGIATLALVALPYAAGDRPLGLDRWLTFAILAVAGWIGFAWRVVELLLAGAFQFSTPAQVLTNGPGLWISAIGLAILVARDLRHDPRIRVPLIGGRPARLGQRPDHPAVDRDDRAGDVGGGRRQQEGRHPAELERVAVAPERDPLDGPALDLLDRDARSRRPARRRAGRSGRSRSGPGARPLMRIGTISSTSDLMRPARPGPDEVRGGQARDRFADGARQDDQDGRVATGAEVRQGGAQEADRAPQRPVDGGLPGGLVELLEAPGGGPPELTTRRSSPPKASTAVATASPGPSGVDRSAGTASAAEPGGGRVQLLAGPADQADPRALGAERLRDRAAEPAAATADERPRAVQPEVHRQGVAVGVGGASMTISMFPRDRTGLELQPEYVAARRPALLGVASIACVDRDDREMGRPRGGRQDRRNVRFQAARIGSRQGDLGDRVPEWRVDAKE